MPSEMITVPIRRAYLADDGTLVADVAPQDRWAAFTDDELEHIGSWAPGEIDAGYDVAATDRLLGEVAAELERRREAAS